MLIMTFEFSIIGDIGGQLGLFVGGSFLTIFEFGEYIYDKCFQQTKRKQRAISRRVQTFREKRRTASMRQSPIHANLSGNLSNLKPNDDIKSSRNVRANGIKSKFTRSPHIASPTNPISPIRTDKNGIR